VRRIRNTPGFDRRLADQWLLAFQSRRKARS
jgi:hypothetical protein